MLREELRLAEPQMLLGKPQMRVSALVVHTQTSGIQHRNKR